MLWLPHDLLETVSKQLRSFLLRDTAAFTPSSKSRPLVAEMLTTDHPLTRRALINRPQHQHCLP
jgi:hypothetical protein